MNKQITIKVNDENKINSNDIEDSGLKIKVTKNAVSKSLKVNNNNAPSTIKDTLSDSEYIALLNSIVSEKLQDPAPPKPALRLLHISHLDLDGYGSTILSEILKSFYPEGAMTLETKNILLNKLNQTLTEALDHDEDYDMIVITDLAINQDLINIIREHPHGDKIRVFDHHITDIDKLPDNFVISENSPLHPNKLTCATELYYDYIRNDKIYGLIKDNNIRKAIAYFVECVRVYDTFEFWPSRNDSSNELDLTYVDAPRLNILFHIVEREEFHKYIFDYIFSGMWDHLTQSTPLYPWVSKVLELEQNKNAKYVESAVKRMTTTQFKYTIYKEGKVYNLDYVAGVIFAEKSSPVIANTALERYDNIDFCAVVSNNQISIYSNKNNIDVSKIARIFGGGGHFNAAGFTIPYINASVFNMEHFGKMIECAGNFLDYNNLFEDIDVNDTN